MSGSSANVPHIASDEEAERLFGPWGRGLVTEMNRLYPRAKIFDVTPAESFTGGHLAFSIGQCSRCGHYYTIQMVTVRIPGKNEALCSRCVAKDAEKRRSDWFAAEERQAR